MASSAVVDAVVSAEAGERGAAALVGGRSPTGSTSIRSLRNGNRCSTSSRLGDSPRWRRSSHSTASSFSVNSARSSGVQERDARLQEFPQLASLRRRPRSAGTIATPQRVSAGQHALHSTSQLHMMFSFKRTHGAATPRGAVHPLAPPRHVAQSIPLASPNGRSGDGRGAQALAANQT